MPSTVSFADRSPCNDGRMRSRRFIEEHALLRRTIRAFVEKEVVSLVAAWEEAGRTIASGASEMMREIIAKRLRL
jgi:hypothetical protein